MGKNFAVAAVIVGLFAAVVPVSAPAVTAAAETDDAHDTYSEEIFRSFIGRVDGEQWSGECDRGYWLDARAGAPHYPAGRGFIVQMQAAVPVLLVEYPWKRLLAGGFVIGSGGDATNFDPFYARFVGITMVCTTDPAYGWAG